MKVFFELGDHMANNDSTTVAIHKLPSKKRVPTSVEDHYDDCGDDVTSNTLPPSDNESQTYHLAYTYDHLNETQPDLTPHYENNSFDNIFYFHGADYDPHTDTTTTCPNNCCSRCCFSFAVSFEQEFPG